MLSRCEKMDQEMKKKNKRAKEEEGENEIVGSSFENDNNAKKRGFGISFMKDNEKVEEEEGFWDSNTNLAFGVFDFPWLKDGIISKLEDLEGFEDNFMSSLEQQVTSFKGGSGIDLFDEYGLCETPKDVDNFVAHIPESELVENVWKPFEFSNGLELEAEGVDNCAWTPLFNQPL